MLARSLHCDGKHQEGCVYHREKIQVGCGKPNWTLEMETTCYNSLKCFFHGHYKQEMGSNVSRHFFNSKTRFSLSNCHYLQPEQQRCS